MPITEIRDRGDANTRLTQFFKEGDIAKHKNAYLDLLGMLCSFNGDTFKKTLAIVSKHIWHWYNDPTLVRQRNRYTQSILKVGERYGFSCQANVVFVGPLDAKAFGERVKGRVLWKDSFANDHGEFSHSYQWLSACRALDSVNSDTYAATAGVMSRVPLFKVSNGGLIYARAPLWEWLVDCSLYQEKYDGQVRKAVEEYFDGQINRFLSGDLTETYFVDNFLKDYFKDDFFEQSNGKLSFKEEFAREKRRNNHMKIIRILSSQLNAKEQFLDGQVRLFKTRNALTKKNDAGGSFRSANNVTNLVRANPDWFINLYEAHRTGKAGDFKSKDDKVGRMRQASQDGREAVIAELNKNTWRKDSAEMDQMPNKMQKEIKSGRNRADYQAWIKDRSKDGTSVLPVKYGVEGKLFTAELQSAHFLEGMKLNRIKHYDGQDKKGEGWAARDDFVFEKEASKNSPTDKEMTLMYFHGMPGYVSSALDDVNLNK